MIIRTLQETLGTDREISTPKWVSRRLLLKKDKMGFSLHETTVFAGEELKMCYLNHLEAVYCISGEGEVQNYSDGKTHPLKVGSLYALDQNDSHILRAFSEMKFVCVFNPPLVGDEVHNESGAYDLIDEGG